MKNLLILAILIFSLGLSHADYRDTKNTHYFSVSILRMEDPTIYKKINPIKNVFLTEDQLKVYCDKRIKAVDKQTYSWFSPAMTEKLGYGNCIDITMYYCYVANTRFRCKYEIAMVTNKNTNEGHAIIDMKNGKFYDPQTGMYIVMGEKWIYQYSISLKEALNIAYLEFGNL